MTLAAAPTLLSASASTTDIDPEAIAAAILRSEEMARIAPEDPDSENWQKMAEIAILRMGN